LKLMVLGGSVLSTITGKIKNIFNKK